MLTTLTVSHDDSDSTSSSGATLSPPPVFDLSHLRLPFISSISMSHASMALTPALASQLCFLEMKSGIVGASHQLPLEPFLAALGSFSQLQKLSLIRCFAAPRPGGPPPDVVPAARSPLSASRLTDVVIEDYPSSIGRIMSELDVPSSANVVLRGNARGATVELCRLSFLAMLPHNLHRMQILRACESIEVTVTHRMCRVYGSMAKGGDHTPPGVTLELELDTGLCHTQGHAAYPAAQTARKQLLSSLLRSLEEIFLMTETITYLKIHGPVGAIIADDWITSLFPLHNLRHLVVVDEYLVEFPDRLLDCLRARPVLPPDAPPLCPALDSLELYGDIKFEEEGTTQLELLVSALQWRMQNEGITTLRILKVGLFSTVALPVQALEHYRREFYRLTLKSGCSLEVKVSPLHSRTHA
ncbi:uncharacterized protein TRAVEDRAFT_42542 [Trametes versicolor FP-101664 SS1]|uniref:uncharacterized protein n=1 Tax=Trametes versicolor (strain FP-101664) TaxID=717944 RepID=UPI0004624754|nr:uncharacterized protein TRAVEDRAFT_42542 [Trametes versicolor FP-101664 SS1]EIW65164.1 hypothetical protein TRAVEDRAFT_42542 [Trametes versicolor FP-101664 SS1]